MNPKVSVIIPALNEASLISDCLKSAVVAGADEIVVVDGGSNDGTVQAAEEFADGTNTPIQVTVAGKGRGPQLNRGAALATGQILLFLHADCQLSDTAISELCGLCHQAADYQSSTLVFGGFRQRIRARGFMFRLLELGNSLRLTLRRLPYGDQGVFVSRELYDLVGGFPEIPLMEDVEFARQLSQHCRPQLLDGPIHLTDRGWRKHGVLKQTIFNWWLYTKYRWGGSPHSLSEIYRKTQS